MIEQFVQLGNGQRAAVSLSEPFLRYASNPILTPHHVNAVWHEPHLQVKTVHNAGVARLKNETIMLFRSHLRSGVSVLGVARSKDGVEEWRIDPQPALKPATKSDSFASNVDPAEIIGIEAGGVEDARINPIDDTFAITYSAYRADDDEANRVKVCLATTDDFKTFIRYGEVSRLGMRNVVLFPEKISGKYVALLRPNDDTEGDVGGRYSQISIGYSDDFRSGEWQIDPAPIMQTGHGPSVFQAKIGPGAPSIRTKHGWLNIFHGVRTTMDGNPYSLGVALHDLADPRKVQMSSLPVVMPTKADCRVKETDYVHVPNVVFTCGAVRQPDGTIPIYYGGNDTVMNLGASHEDILAEMCTRYGQDPLSGKLLYSI